MDLTLKFVFLESKDPEKVSSYHDGEYVVLRETPHSIYGVKPVGGYYGHRLEAFAKRDYSVHDPYEDDKALDEFIRELRHFSETPKRGEKLAWIQSVYSEAGRVVGQFERARARKRTERLGMVGQKPPGLGPRSSAARCPHCFRALKITSDPGRL